MKKSILIMGDSVDFRMILSAILSDRYKVYTAEIVSEALGIIENSMINLVITAPKLPHESCFDLTDALKKSQKNNDVPVVLASSGISQTMLAKAHKNNIVDLIKLPLEPTELEEKVDSILMKYARSYEKPDPVTGLHKKTYGEEQIEDLLDGDTKGTLMLLEVCRFSFASSKISSKLLVATSNVLKEAISKKAVLCVAASGGFMIFEPSLREKAAIEKYANNLIRTLNRKSETKDLFVSIGLAVTDRHGTNFKDLFLACDMGLGIARQDGRNKACFYKW